MQDDYKCDKFNVGDRGYRYEVQYLDSDGKRKVFGWSNTISGAKTMCKSIYLHPIMKNPTIVDRDSGLLVED